MEARKQRRGIGIVRVSQVGDREPDRFTSPDDQGRKIRAACASRDIELIGEPFQEINVSGGSPLSKRPGLRAALEEVEAGRADVIVVAYFDRLFRSIKVQAEVAERVEAAGGSLLAADVGEIGGESAAQWMSASQLGVVAEYQRRSTAERVRFAQQRAVEQKGRPPFPLIPGYRRVPGGGIELHPTQAPIVRQAFEMRADRKSLREIKDFLARHGIKRSSLNSTHMMFRNRMVLGEIHYRDWTGTCPRLIDDELWERVQATVGAPRGRNAKSDRLLARLRVLRCASCGGRMSATLKTNQGRAVPFYRCANVNCQKRATVGAKKVEELVIEAVMHSAGHLTGSASRGARVREAQAAAERAQQALSRAIAKIDAAGLDDEPEAIEKLKRLRKARDEAGANAAVAARSMTELEVLLEQDWDALSLQGQRDLVVALIERVLVRSGTGPDKVTIDRRGHPRVAAVA